MRKLVRRSLILGMVGPAGLAPLVVLGWQGKGYPWWHYLVAIVGGGYLIPVFGTLVGWKLLRRISQRAGSVIRFVLWALVGIAVFSASLITVHMGDARKWPFRTWDGLLMLLVYGLLFAGIPLIAGWRQQHK